MHVLVLSDNFVPENNAPALRTHEHCRRWVEQGVKVTVVTTIPNFPLGKPLAGYRNKFRQEEIIDGIRVIRVWSVLAPNWGVARRAVDFLSYAVMATLLGRGLKPDVILATSPQLLTGLAGYMLSRGGRHPWIFEVRDLWPESIVAVGAMHNGTAVSVLRRLEHFLYRKASRIVTVSEGLRGVIASSGVPQEKVSVVSNGVNLDRLRNSAASAPDPAYFTVGYVGTHGMAHGLDSILRAALILKHRTDIRFKFVGEGAKRQELIALARMMELDNVEFVGMVPSGEVGSWLARCDVVVVPLKQSPLVDTTLPSKIFEAAAMGRPVILCATGIAADIVQSFGSGIVVEPEDSAAIAAAIVRLHEDPDRRRQLAEGGAALANAYDRRKLADRMLEELRLVAGASVR